MRHRRKRSSPQVTSSKRARTNVTNMEGNLVDTDNEEMFNASQASRSQTGEKTTPKPTRQPAVVKTLMNIFSDPDSPVVQALVGALEKSIILTIQKELSDQSAKIDQLLSKIEKLEKENHEKN